MSVFGLNTFSAMRTPVAPINVGSLTNITSSATPTTRVPTSTRPATTTSGNGAGVVVGVPPERTYAKVQPLASNSGGTYTFHVVGWNVDASGVWRPQPLSSWTVVNSGTSMSINGASLFPGNTYTKLAGDAKNYDVNATITNGGFLLLDACGCELIEAIATGAITTNVIATGAITTNVIIGFI